MKNCISIKIPNYLKEECIPIVKELIEANDILWIDTVDFEAGIVYRIDFAELSQKCEFVCQMEKKGINTLLVI